MSLDTLSHLHILESFTPGVSPNSSTLASSVPSSASPYTFHTLDDAYTTFIELILALCGTMVPRTDRVVPIPAASFDSSSRPTSNDAIHSSHFRSWVHAYTALLAGAGPNRWRSASDRLAMQLLDCQAMLSRSVSASYTIPARCNSTMREMLQSVAAFMRHRQSGGGGLRRDSCWQRPRLTLDIGLVVTLYGAAVLMDDSDVRLEAIGLLTDMVCTAPAQAAR